MPAVAQTASRKFQSTRRFIGRILSFPAPVSGDHAGENHAYREDFILRVLGVDRQFRGCEQVGFAREVGEEIDELIDAAGEIHAGKDFAVGVAESFGGEEIAAADLDAIGVADAAGDFE